MPSRGSYRKPGWQRFLQSTCLTGGLLTSLSVTTTAVYESCTNTFPIRPLSRVPAALVMEVHRSLFFRSDTVRPRFPVVPETIYPREDRKPRRIAETLKGEYDKAAPNLLQS